MAVKMVRDFVAFTIVLSASLNSEMEVLANIGTRACMSYSPLMSAKTSFQQELLAVVNHTYCNAQFHPANACLLSDDDRIRVL